jgi:hypothetical protein
MGIEPFACSDTQTWNGSCIFCNGCWRQSIALDISPFRYISILVDSMTTQEKKS